MSVHLDNYDEQTIEEYYEDVIKTVSKLDQQRDIFISDRQIADLLGEQRQDIDIVLDSLAAHNFIRRDYQGTNIHIYRISGLSKKEAPALELYERYLEGEEHDWEEELEDSDNVPHYGAETF